MKKRPIAIHLPQYHPFPENDEWWCKGFTEWTNVTNAKPLLKDMTNQYTLRILDIMNLRVPEIREQQAQMAKDYGLYGFIYYHYCFGKKKLMETIANDVLTSGKPDFPFCFCWANETWSGMWQVLRKRFW